MVHLQTLEVRRNVQKLHDASCIIRHLIDYVTVIEHAPECRMLTYSDLFMITNWQSTLDMRSIEIEEQMRK